MALVPFNSDALMPILEERDMNILDLSLLVEGGDSIKFLETKFVNGKDYVNLWTLLNVARALGVSIGELIQKQ